MPSPFPGMDPFLEHPAISAGLHQWLVTQIAMALDAVLPSGCGHGPCASRCREYEYRSMPRTPTQ